MVPFSKPRRKRLLSHSRPPTTKRATSLSSRATRALIREHHTLQKKLHLALNVKNTQAAACLQTQMSSSGGLVRYQQASILGQSPERGGDSSRILLDWLQEALAISKKTGSTPLAQHKLRMLEVGALSVDNACSRSGFFDMTRIDLHSQHSEIETQDFMKRPPILADKLREEGFDIVSLSLVVNYVGDAMGRGEMLSRVSSFLKNNVIIQENMNLTETMKELTPSLFLVLPASCVTNSRYLDEDKLEDMMNTLGYLKVRRKMSHKLVYYLWKYRATADSTQCKSFYKKAIKQGASRNNFAIVL
ncbi:MAG: hypothetical protein Q9190_001502 [Brigantiaea leucoxantha]